jgi:hypothetical protein
VSQPESRRVVGRLRLELRDAAGALLRVVEGENLVTNVGKERLSAIVAGLTSTLPGYIALGTTNTAANVTDTQLAAEIVSSGGQRRAVDTQTRTTTTVTNDTISYTSVFTFTGSFAIVEAGLLDASSAGNLFARRVFSAVNVVNGNVLNAVWTLAFA